MTLQQLRYLIAIAEYGSINAAAQNLYASQSNLSTAIKELEQELGITVFTRSNRGVTLTNDGTELLGYARQVIEQADMPSAKSPKRSRFVLIFSIASTKRRSIATGLYNAIISSTSLSIFSSKAFTLRSRTITC